MRRRGFITMFASILGLVRGSAQDALVAELTAEEVAKARELHAKLLSAQENWNHFRDAIRDKYGPSLAGTVPRSRRSGLTSADGRDIIVPDGWAHGVEFSTDFRFAVPSKKQ